ncbi:MAG: Phytoene dehydrogenase [Micrococcaceae bacterium]|nr:Phytoene dehydrogenase [Micrococcaceae bacterium]
MTGHAGPPRAVVIGAGISGLATAALLARRGYEVTVLEKQDEVGGRAGSWSSKGYRFDTGPSWYLMPEVFDHFFRLLGSSAQQELDLVRLDPGYRVIFESHREQLDVPAGRSANVALFEAVEPGAGSRLERYLDSARRTYAMATQRFLYTTFASFRPLLTFDVLRQAATLLQLFLQPLDRFAGRSFSSPQLRQILGYPAVFLGSSPFDAPAMYHLMSHLDLEDGVYYPRGGFTGVIRAVQRLAETEGVRILTGAPATAVLTTSDGPRTGTSAAGRKPAVRGVRYRTPEGVDAELPADVVVGTADLHHLETELLPESLQTYPAAYWRRRTAGPGAVLLCLGVRGRLPQLQHHTLLFTSDWRDNFGKIFSDPRSVPDPASLYICAPSRTDTTVAPPDGENLFVLVPVPADPALGTGGVDGNGSPDLEAIADRVIGQIADWAGIPDLADRIVTRRTFGPGDFAADLNAWQGSALGPAHVLRQSAFFRASNTSRKVSGLYYAGSSTQPGIGLPMCLISAELVLKRLDGDTSTGPLAEPLRPAESIWADTTDRRD